MPNQPRRQDDEQSVTSVNAGDELTVTFQNPIGDGIQAVQLQAISIDQGWVSHGSAAVKAAQIKVFPERHPEACGGDVYQTFATLDSFQQNRIPYGVWLEPGERVRVKIVLNSAAKTVRVRVERLCTFA